MLLVPAHGIAVVAVADEMAAGSMEAAIHRNIAVQRSCAGRVLVRLCVLPDPAETHRSNRLATFQYARRPQVSSSPSVGLLLEQVSAYV